MDGKQTELFTTSNLRSCEPSIVKITDTAFTLAREKQTVLVNDKGGAEGSKALRWSDTPTSLVWDEPYILGVIQDSIEIQSIEPGGLVQTLDNLSKVRLITRCRQGLLYAASAGNVWFISGVEVATQRKVLLDNKHFQLAIQLTVGTLTIHMNFTFCIFAPLFRSMNLIKYIWFLSQ